MTEMSEKARKLIEWMDEYRLEHIGINELRAIIEESLAQASREGWERGKKDEAENLEDYIRNVKQIEFNGGYKKGVEDAAKVAEKFDRRNDPTALRIATAIRELSKPKEG